MRTLFWYEFKKLITNKALWAFLVLCVLFNIGTVLMNSNIEIDSSTPFPVNVFHDFDTLEIAEVYITELELSGRAARLMRAKYYALQPVVYDKALAGVSYDAYLGIQSHFMHQRLFSTFPIEGLMGRLYFMGILLSVFLGLLSTTYEKANNTEDCIYATKTGRYLLRYKIAASLAACLGLYVLLVLVSLFSHILVFDYANAWDSSISSGFNYLLDQFIGMRPFITWRSFTVASYLLAHVGSSIGLIICFLFFGIIVGICSKNEYIGFLIVILINAAFVALPSLFSINSVVRYVVMHSPIWIWWHSGLWFTDGGYITLWRHFELWGIGISLILLIALCILLVKMYEKKFFTK